MKKASLILAVMFVASVVARADTDRFVLKFRGTITSITNSAHKIKVKETDLVLTNGNLLVYEIEGLTNAPLDSLNLVETDSTGTNVLRENCHSDDNAVDHNRRLVVFDIHDSEGFSPNIGNIPVFDGRLFAVGRGAPAKGTLKTIRLKVSGIWSDSQNLLFKGTITGTRQP